MAPFFVSHSQAIDPEQLTDRQLFETAQRIGALALKSRREFIGLLPLIERRRAYEGRMFYSIYDFAAKVGGISKDVVIEVLRVDAYLVDTPKLRKKLYRGEIGWSKIRSIMHMVNRGNEDEWIQKLENLSKSALEVYLRDYQNQLAGERPTLWSSPIQEISNKIIENGVKFEAESIPGDKTRLENNTEVIQPWSPQASSPAPSKLAQLAHERETFTFSLQSDIAARLRLFRQKLEKDRRELITWEEVMMEFLKMIESEMQYKEIKRAEQRTGQKAEQKPNPDAQQNPDKPTTRYIPAHVRHALDQQYGGLCAFKNCKQPATIYHHTKRFALTKHLASQEVHDPDFIKPLCEPHERIIHNTLIENEEIDPTTWKILATPDKASQRHKVDQQVIAYRKLK